MKTVGKQLQDARLAKGWSPEMAARETKIRLDRVRELEEDDYSNFSSPTYARGFVRTYARALGLDEYRILRQLDNKLPEDDNASFANDTGVPYMPEPSQVAKPFQVGRGVYIAGGVGMALLLLIGFILVQSYRAGYFASATPAPAALPVTATNTPPAVPDAETARALPADSNAAPVPVPVDLPPAAAVAAAPAAAPVDTNAAPRAQPVDLNAVAGMTNPPAAALAAPSSVAVASAPPVEAATASPAAATAPVPDGTASSPTVSPATSTPPRALPVDLNALSPDATTNAPMADASPTTPPAPEPRPAPSLSARGSNARPTDVHAAADKATPDLIAATTPPPTEAPPAPASPVVLPNPSAPADPAPVVASASTPDASPPGAPSSLTPMAAYQSENNAPASDAAVTGSPSGSTAASSAPAAESFHGKRLVLTASHDSFVRVIALDGSGTGQVRYSSLLKSGQSISFNDRKYSINVGDPSAVDIALDGVNYGPHSDTSAPDTFTVESHVP